MADIIMHEFEASDSDPMTQLMCVRGLMLLMLNEHPTAPRDTVALYF